MTQTARTVPYPEIFDIQLVQGVSKTISRRWDIRTPDGLTLLGYHNLNDYEANFTVRRKATDVQYVIRHDRRTQVYFVVKAETGRFQLRFPSYLSEDLPVLTEATYDLVLTDTRTTGRTVRLMSGKFTVLPMAEEFA